MIVLILIVLGLCLGSFVNAVVWRVHQQEETGNKEQGAGKSNKKSLSPDALSILHGRSMCPNCRHELSVKDLMPVFSWLALRGRCRYCQKPISWQYPVVETALAAVFVLSYTLWPLSFSAAGQWLLLSAWLAVSVGLMALLIYDFRWMLLPNRILYPTLLIALIGRLGYIGFYSNSAAHDLKLLLASIAVASGFFALLFYVSRGRWIGFGDVRLGLVSGTVLATPEKSLLMLFLGSLLGTCFIVPFVAKGERQITSRMPYGPFLIAATFIVVLFGQSLINWYQGRLL